MPKVGSYTVAKKLEILKWHKENGAVIHQTSKHFNIDRKRIREWLKKEEVLISNNHGKNKNCRKLTTGKTPLSQELDDSLFEFFIKERESGIAVSNQKLSDEASKIATSLGIKDFKASYMFIKRWKSRFNVSMRRGTNEYQDLSEDYQEASINFLSALSG